MMLIQPIDVFVYAWLIVAVGSAVYVAWDQFRGNPEAAVMKWGFVLVTLYTGPVGLLLYVMADKEPSPGSHEVFQGEQGFDGRFGFRCQGRLSRDDRPREGWLSH